MWLGASLTGRHSVGGRRLRLFRWLPAIDRKSGIPTLGPPPSETAPQRRPIAIRLSYPVDSPGGEHEWCVRSQYCSSEGVSYTLICCAWVWSTAVSERKSSHIPAGKRAEDARQPETTVMLPVRKLGMCRLIGGGQV